MPVVIQVVDGIHQMRDATEVETDGGQGIPILICAGEVGCGGEDRGGRFRRRAGQLIEAGGLRLDDMLAGQPKQDVVDTDDVCDDRVGGGTGAQTTTEVSGDHAA